MNDLIVRLVVLVAAALQFVVPLVLNPFADNQDAVRSGPPSQIEPAGYAFAIWGPIYLGAIAYAVWQLTPAGRADPMTARIAPLAIILYLGSSLWLASASQIVPLWATMPILAVMAACASAALVIATNAPSSSAWRFWFAIAPFGLYAGWTVCATFVNIAEVAPQYGFARFGLPIPIYGAASILAAAIVSGVVLWLARGNLVFALTVVWALVAIIIAAQTRGYEGAITIAAGVALAAVVMLTIGARVSMRG